MLDLLQPPRCQLCGGRAVGGAAWTCEAHDPRARAEPPGARAEPPGARAETITCAWCDRRLGPLGRGADRVAGGSGRPLADPPAPPGVVLCPACEQADAEGRPRPVRCIALGAWREGPLADWVLALKHAGRPDLVEPLGSLLAARVLQRLSRDERAARGVLVPLPLHPVRRLERGHDQAALLAHVLARMLGWRVARWLLRRRATPPQGSWWGPPRHANLRGALAVAPWRGPRGCPVPWSSGGRHGPRPSIWLVDDVTTSGATLEEARLALRARGLAVAGALVLARAGDPESVRAPSRAAPARVLPGSRPSTDRTA